jgi:hypothetical protein
MTTAARTRPMRRADAVALRDRLLPWLEQKARATVDTTTPGVFARSANFGALTAIFVFSPGAMHSLTVIDFAVPPEGRAAAMNRIMLQMSWHPHRDGEVVSPAIVRDPDVGAAIFEALARPDPLETIH